MYTENIKSDTCAIVLDDVSKWQFENFRKEFEENANKIKHCPMCGNEIPEDRHICEACEFEERS
jgi:recombinational DNA repair protein RecR